MQMAFSCDCITWAGQRQLRGSSGASAGAAESSLLLPPALRVGAPHPGEGLPAPFPQLC